MKRFGAELTGNTLKVPRMGQQTYRDVLLGEKRCGDSLPYPSAKRAKQDNNVPTLCCRSDEIISNDDMYNMYVDMLKKYWVELTHTKPHKIRREMGVTYTHRHALVTCVYPNPTLAYVHENGEKEAVRDLMTRYIESNDVQGMMSVMAALLKCGCCYKHSHIYEGAPAHTTHPPKRDCTCTCADETDFCICGRTCDRCCNCSCRHELRSGLEWLALR